MLQYKYAKNQNASLTAQEIHKTNASKKVKNMNLQKLFGKKLRQIRISKGLSQQEFAELVKLQPNSISRIEIGRRAVSFATIEKIAKSLGVDYCELFDFEEINSKDAIIKSNTKLMQKLDRELLLFINLSLKNYTNIKTKK